MPSRSAQLLNQSYLMYSFLLKCLLLGMLYVFQHLNLCRNCSTKIYFQDLDRILSVIKIVWNEVADTHVRLLHEGNHEVIILTFSLLVQKVSADLSEALSGDGNEWVGLSDQVICIRINLLFLINMDGVLGFCSCPGGVSFHFIWDSLRFSENWDSAIF